VRAQVQYVPTKERVQRQEQLIKAMSDMLADDNAGSLDCEVCGFKFKSAELRQVKKLCVRVCVCCVY
jgi:hypothetical protein